MAEQPASLARPWSELAGRSVLVTGHTGFKGSWLCLWLEALGARVHGYAWDPPTVPSNFEVSQVGSGLSADWRADVRERSQLADALRESQAEVIFHLAAQSVVGEGYRDPAATFDINVMGTAALLDAVRQAGQPCALVLVSSDKCYHNCEQVWGYRESDPLGGKDPYSASKGAMEVLAASYRESYFPPAKLDRHGVKLATVRAGNVVGGGDWTEGALLVDTIRAFVNDEPAALRCANAVRPWQHVLEPLSGYLQLASRLLTSDDPQWCSSWNFGPLPGDQWPVRKLVEAVAEQWGGGEWRDASRPDQPPEAQQLRLCIDKARCRLDWQPRWSLQQAVQATVRWYRAYFADASSMRDVCLEQIQQYESPGSPALCPPLVR